MQCTSPPMTSLDFCGIFPLSCKF